MRRLTIMVALVSVTAFGQSILDTPVGKACVKMLKPDLQECFDECEEQYASSDPLYPSCFKMCKMEIKQKLEQCIEENQ